LSHFNTNGAFDPLTRNSLVSKPYYPNNAIKSLADKWRLR